MSETTTPSAPPAPAPAAVETPRQASVPHSPDTSLAIVQLLKEEAAAHKRQADGHAGEAKRARDEAAAFKAEIEKMRAEAEAAIAAERARGVEALNMAELKVHAIKAGMVDLDGLKLLDVSKAERNEDGTLKDPDAVIAAFKGAKAYMFGEKTTGVTAPVPPPAAPKTVDAREMTPAEYQAARRRISAGKAP